MKEQNFRPTFLYIKRHRSTGLLYLGKTISHDPVKYSGSGTDWKIHLRDNGTDVETLWFCLFLDQDELVSFARRISVDWDIVSSNLWANNCIEDGVRGWPTGVKRRPETIAKTSASNRGQKRSQSFCDKMSSVHKGKTLSEETRQLLREARKKQVCSPETREKMRKSKLGHVQSEAQKEAARLGSQGTVFINKDGVYRRVKPDVLQTFLDTGWVKGARPRKKLDIS